MDPISIHVLRFLSNFFDTSVISCFRVILSNAKPEPGTGTVFDGISKVPSLKFYILHGSEFRFLSSEAYI
jgi:hypothetical protein